MYLVRCKKNKEKKAFEKGEGMQTVAGFGCHPKLESSRASQELPIAIPGP